MDDLRDKVKRVVRQVVLETVEREGLSRLPAPFDGGRRPLVAANWKMNKLAAEARDFVEAFDPQPDSGVEVVLCPPHILLPVVREAADPAVIGLGAQNLHPEREGAYTGEHSADMIRDAGARYVIVGHSERREMGEDDGLVRRKILAALAAGLGPIVCVGERRAERESRATLRVLRNQLSQALGGLSSPAPDPLDLVIAYEPVWAIGTGQHAAPGQVQEAMAFVRERLAELFSHAWAARVRLLYGGSVSDANAAELAALPDVDGFLIGGAGLDPRKLSKIVATTGRVRAAGLARRD